MGWNMKDVQDRYKGKRAGELIFKEAVPDWGGSKGMTEKEAAILLETIAKTLETRGSEFAGWVKRTEETCPGYLADLCKITAEGLREIIGAFFTGSDHLF